MAPCELAALQNSERDGDYAHEENQGGGGNE